MKRVFLCMLAMIFVGLFSVFFFAEEDSVLQGEDITDRVSLDLIKGSGKSSRLLDRNVETSCSTSTTSPLFELKISSEEPIYGIYLLWNNDVAQWTLTGEGETVIGGEDGFWHEYKPLSGEKEYTLTWENCPDADLAEVYFLSEGTVPDFVQIWEPPCEKADFLLLPTHADDEHLWFGGTMPYYGGELGYKIQVVYLMKHVSGRHHELLNGLWHVGIRNYPVISEFVDKYCGSLSAAKKLYPEEDVLDFLVENIRRFRPEVIVGHDLDGEYGHGAHILNATVLSERAVFAANDAELCPESFEKYGTWETKKCYLHLYQENEVFLDWSSKILSAFGGKTAYEMAQEGFDQHVSQRDAFSMSLDNRAKYGNALFGLIYTTVGEDVKKDDFLENIPAEALTTWVEPEPIPDPDPIVTDTSHPTEISPAQTSSEQTAAPSTARTTGIIVIVAVGAVWLIVMVAIFLFRKKK